MILDDYLRTTPASARWAERARKAMPSGITADTRMFMPYAPYIQHARGVQKVDVDGNQLLDFFGGHGALLLGHGYGRVERAITDALVNGIQYASNHPLEVRWAERVTRHIPSAELVRFTGSGTEATLLALRIARASTGRAKIVRIATHYHGWHDMVASGYNGQFDGTAAPGVLKEIADNTLLVANGDYDRLKAVFDQHGGEIAALIMEPVGAHFGIVPTDDDFLRAGQEAAHSHGALLILDEVISGFRVGLAGMQGQVGLRPDLTTLGKVAAGGMPGGLVCGTARAMAVLTHDSARKILHQGTFTGNPVTAAAAIATIDEIAERHVCERVNELGHLARLRLNGLFARKAVPWNAHGRFSAFHLLPGSQPGVAVSGRSPDPQSAKRIGAQLAALRMGLILEGVDIGSRGSGFLSFQHGEEHIDMLIAAVERVLDRLAVDEAAADSMK